MSPEFYFNPENPNSNIHGVVGSQGEKTCQTQHGTRCTGCCLTHAFEKPDGPGILKDPDLCDAQMPGLGCRFAERGEFEKRFPGCSPYHCSDDLKTLADKNASEEERLNAKTRLAWANHASQSLIEISTDSMNRNNLHIDLLANLGAK